MWEITPRKSASSRQPHWHRHVDVKRPTLLVAYGVSFALSRRFGDYTTEWSPGPIGVCRYESRKRSQLLYCLPLGRNLGELSAANLPQADFWHASTGLRSGQADFSPSANAHGRDRSELMPVWAKPPAYRVNSLTALRQRASSSPEQNGPTSRCQTGRNLRNCCHRWAGVSHLWF